MYAKLRIERKERIIQTISSQSPIGQDMKSENAKSTILSLKPKVKFRTNLLQILDLFKEYHSSTEISLLPERGRCEFLTVFKS